MSKSGKSKIVKQADKKAVVQQPMVFKKQNFILLLLSLAVVVIGFIVMSSGNDKPFDHPTKITVAPLIVLAGFALGVFSILYTPKTEEDSQTEK